MNRRTLLRGAGAAVGGAGLTLAGLRVGSEPAAAATELTVTGDDVELAADGSVTAVTLALDVEWSHDLPSGAAPQAVAVSVRAGREGDLDEVATAQASSLFPENSGTESVAADLLAAGALEESAVSPDGGESVTVAVVIKADVAVETADGETLADATARTSADVTIARAVAGEASVSGSGSLTVETDG